MSVSEILSHKGKDVCTMPFSAAIEEVAEILAERKIGAIIVLDKSGNVAGIASERDIIRRIAAAGSSALKESVSKCMTKEVISCEPDDTIDSVMTKMTAGRFRHMPVMHGGKLEGIISIGDVVKLKIRQAERDAEDMKRYIAG